MPDSNASANAAPDLFGSIKQFVTETIDQIKAARSDGQVTWTEAMTILAGCVQRLVAEAALLRGVAGADKKAAVMAAIGQTFDMLAAAVDIPYIPEPIESMVVEPALKKGVLLFADGLIEVLVKQLPKPAV